MKYKVKLSLITDDGNEIETEEIFEFKKENERIEHIGLSLKESKSILSSIQNKLVKSQVNQVILKTLNCQHCQKIRKVKSYRKVKYRTLFGDVEFKRPRYLHCHCESNSKKNISPLSEFFEDYVSPEFYYMESKGASLLSYGVTLDLLKDCFPISDKLNIETIRQHTYKVAN